MQMLDGSQSLKKVELGIRFIHPSHFSQQIEQLSSVTVLHTEYEIVSGFEAGIEASSKRMSRTFLKDHPFALDYVLLFVFEDELFVDGLESHDFAICSTEIDPREPARTHTFNDFEVVQ
jgi:hypothetical protein